MRAARARRPQGERTLTVAAAPSASGRASGVALKRWLQRSGALVNIEVAESVAEGRGVVASRTVQTGEALLIVPQPLLLTAHVARSSDVGRELDALGGPDVTDSQLLIAAFLMDARTRHAGRWSAYVDALPRAAPLVPPTFSDEQLALLNGSAVQRRAIERRAAFRAQYDRIRAGAPRLAECSYEQFLWARTIVPSRAFALEMGGPPVDALVPLGDMLNHKRPPDATWCFDEPTDAFVLAATRRIEAGEVVHDSYGAKCNARLLLFYGFCLDDNPCNEAAVQFPGVARDHPAFAECKTLGLTVNDAREFRLGASAEVGQEADCRRYLAHTLVPGEQLVHDDPRISEAIATACDASLSRYDTDMAADIELLARDTAPGIERTCAQLRLGEKQVLHAVRERCRIAY